MRKILILFVAVWFILCVAAAVVNVEVEAAAASEEPTPVVVVTPKPTPELAPSPEPEPVVIVTYPVPLDQELQDFIVHLCEERNIAPCIVFAMIERESSYRADAVGDNGRSYGLLQVQTRWHGERMERLGVTNLLNPYENVTVGVDYLAEMIDRGNGLEWALAAYNAGATGAYKGRGAAYAQNVLDISETIAEGVNERVLQ